MAYVWKNYSTQKKFKITSTSISPYIEVWDAEQDIIFVNIYLRLYDILVPFEDNQSAEEKVNTLLELYEEDKRYQDIVNILIHSIAQQDLCKGLTFQDVVAHILYKRIYNEWYGKEIRDKFNSLKEDHKRIIVRYLAKYEISHEREIQLDAVTKAIFKEINIYFEKSTGILHFYINEEKNSYNTKLFELICYFFKDIDVKVEVLWKYEHFGIIDVDETMCIGEIALI